MIGKRWLARNLVVLVVATFIAVIALALSALLQAGNDQAGSQAVLGVLWVAVTVLLGSALVQLVLLTLNELARESTAERPAESGDCETATDRSTMPR